MRAVKKFLSRYHWEKVLGKKILKKYTYMFHPWCPVVWTFTRTPTKTKANLFWRICWFVVRDASIELNWLSWRSFVSRRQDLEYTKAINKVEIIESEKALFQHIIILFFHFTLTWGQHIYPSCQRDNEPKPLKTQLLVLWRQVLWHPSFSFGVHIKSHVQLPMCGVQTWASSTRRLRKNIIEHPVIAKGYIWTQWDYKGHISNQKHIMMITNIKFL